jgi:hypothetical protein
VNPWFETAAVITVTLLGIIAGKIFSGFRRPYWIIGYSLPLVLIAILAASRWSDSFTFVPPFYWLIAGRIRFIVLSLAVTIGLTTPLSRLPYKFEKFIICVLMAIVVVWFSVLPFLVPALIRDGLSKTNTIVNIDGICFQSRDYTCGPAAAVTALRILGLPAEEGEIAILSHTSPITGTLPSCLCDALQERYGDEGLKCRYRRFDDIGQLKDAGLTLAVVRDAFLSDHCVVVLDVSDRKVTIADPVLGRRSMPYEQFEKVWRFSGIVLSCDSKRNT